MNTERWKIYEVSPVIAQLSALGECPGCSAGRDKPGGGESPGRPRQLEFEDHVREERAPQREREVQRFAEGTPQVLG